MPTGYACDRLKCRNLEEMIIKGVEKLWRIKKKSLHPNYLLIE